MVVFLHGGIFAWDWVAQAWIDGRSQHFEEALQSKTDEQKVSFSVIAAAALPNFLRPARLPGLGYQRIYFPHPQF